MAGRRLSMRRMREILRQKWALGRSHREVAQSLGVSTGAISAVLARANTAQLSWEAIEGLDEVELERRLYGSALGGPSARPLPDWAEIHTELARKGVTLALLHMEYLECHPDGYGYTQFCRYYKRKRSDIDALSLGFHRVEHRSSTEIGGNDARPVQWQDQTVSSGVADDLRAVFDKRSLDEGVLPA